MLAPAETRQRLSAWTLLAEGEVGILYDRRTLDLKPLGPELAAALGGLVAQAETLTDDAPEWPEFAGVVESVDAMPGLDSIAAAVPSARMPRPAGGEGANRLFKLAISVADTCNLACTYCYANRGHYERPVGRVMTPDLAQQVVENALLRFDAIETVQFIGGEPSLNLPAIERVCETFARAVDEGRLPAMPRFVITTNGLRLGAPFIRLARAFDVRPTVSLDGPREVHDRARVTAEGAGSYDRILAGVDALVSAGVGVEYEATFTRLHLDAGIHLIDLCAWFRDNLGVRVLHAPPVSAGPYTLPALTLSLAEQIREYCAAAEWTVDNLMVRGDWMGNSFSARVLQSLTAKSRSRSICAAGHDLLCVAGDGGVYPCWMFIGEPDLHLGSFLRPDPRPWDWSQAKALLGPGDLGEHAACQGCFARDLCFGCRAADFRATGDRAGKASCLFTQAIIATVLLRIFHVTRAGADEPRTAAEYLGRPSFGERIFGPAAT